MNGIINAIKTVLVGLCVAFTLALAGGIWASANFIIGWKSGMKMLVLDSHMITAEELYGNEYILYLLTLMVFIIIVKYYTMFVDKFHEADSMIWFPLFFINVFGAAALLAAPYFYAYYV